MTQIILKIILISFIVFIILSLTAYVLWRIFQKRWKCTETGCEQHITGKYKNEAECNKKCKENDDSVIEDITRQHGLVLRITNAFPQKKANM